MAGNLSRMWMEKRQKGGCLESVVGEKQPKHRRGDKSKCVWRDHSCRGTAGWACTGAGPHLLGSSLIESPFTHSEFVIVWKEAAYGLGEQRLISCLNSLSRKIVESQLQKEQVRCQQLRGLSSFPNLTQLVNDRPRINSSPRFLASFSELLILFQTKGEGCLLKETSC